jgi:hypothetical protein
VTRVAASLLAAAALAGCGDAAPRAHTATKPPGRPIPCPADAPAKKALDARAVVGLTESRAKALTDRHGCTLVVVVRDGEHFSIIANVDRRRLQVEVKGGVVSRIVTVG